MNVGGVLEAFRRYVDDTTPPYFLSDADSIRFIDEAQRELARLVVFLLPGTYDIVTVPGQVFYDFPLQVLRFRCVYISNPYSELDVCTFEQARSLSPYLLNSDRVGVPKSVVLGEQKNQIRLSPTPNLETTVRCMVYKKPDVTLETVDQELEIENEHHYYLLHWMAYRFYSLQDAETFDLSKAQDELNMFVDYANRVQLESTRQNYTPKQVLYGGI